MVELERIPAPVGAGRPRRAPCVVPDELGNHQGGDLLGVKRPGRRVGARLSRIGCRGREGPPRVLGDITKSGQELDSGGARPRDAECQKEAEAPDRAPPDLLSPTLLDGSERGIESDGAEEEIRHLEVGREDHERDHSADRGAPYRASARQEELDGGEEKGRECRHEELPVVSWVDQRNHVRSKEVCGPAHECGALRAPQRADPSVHEAAREEYMQHELPSEGPVRLGELQEEERGRVERVSAGERFEKGCSPEDLRIPEGIPRGPERFREEGACGVAEREGVLSDQHPVREDELAEEEDGGGGEEEENAPRR